MNYVELHTVNGPVLVNLEQVRSVYTEGDGTIVRYAATDDRFLKVTETYEQIKDMILAEQIQQIDLQTIASQLDLLLTKNT